MQAQPLKTPTIGETMGNKQGASSAIARQNVGEPKKPSSGAAKPKAGMNQKKYGGKVWSY